jgi:hypothetical protein
MNNSLKLIASNYLVKLANLSALAPDSLGQMGQAASSGYGAWNQ